MPFLSVYAGLEVHVHVHGHVPADTGYVYFIFAMIATFIVRMKPKRKHLIF